MASPSFSPQSILARLTTPVFLATIVSVGAHGLFFAAAPLLSASKEKPEEQESVPVVNLSPEDAARLPNALLSEPNPFGGSNPLISQDGESLLPVPGSPPPFGDLSGLDSNPDFSFSQPTFGDPGAFLPPSKSTFLDFGDEQSMAGNNSSTEVADMLARAAREQEAAAAAREAAEQQRRQDEAAQKRKQEAAAQKREQEAAEQQRKQEAAAEAERLRLLAEQERRCQELAQVETTIENALDKSRCGLAGAPPPPDEKPPDETAKLALAYTKLGEGDFAAETPSEAQLNELESLRPAGSSPGQSPITINSALSIAFPDPDFSCPADAEDVLAIALVLADGQPQFFLANSTGYPALDGAVRAKLQDFVPPEPGWEKGKQYILQVEMPKDFVGCKGPAA